MGLIIPLGMIPAAKPNTIRINEMADEPLFQRNGMKNVTVAFECVKQALLGKLVVWCSPVGNVVMLKQEEYNRLKDIEKKSLAN